MSKNILGIFDGYDIEGIKALVESLEESSFDYMKLEGDGVSITIGKNGAGETPVAAVAAPTAVPAAIAAAPVAVQAPEAAPPVAAVPDAKPVGDVAEQDGVVIVRSPSYGIFYAQSEPGAPTYVKLGDMVKEGETMCLVEIMKTFNAITAPVSGELVAIHIQNAEMLEPEMPLFSIRVK